MWDSGGDRSPISPLWRAARELDPTVADEAARPGARDGDLLRLFVAAELHGATQSELSVTRRFERFEDWWALMTLGVGPAGDHVASLSPERRAALRARCASSLGPGPFEVTGTAWAVVATR